MKSSTRKCVATIAISGLILFAAGVSRSRSLSWRGIGSLALEKPAVEDSPYDPYFILTHIQIVSNALSDSRFVDLLATKTGADSVEFEFNEVRQLRSTSILDIDFSARDSDTAMCIVSNACAMLADFYSTNHPTVRAEYVDVRVRRPADPLQIFVEWLRESFDAWTD